MSPHASRAVVAFRNAWHSRAVTRGDALATLLRMPAATHAPSAPAAEARRATVLAFRTLRVLARVPRGGWQNTCLFRAISECLVLRELGHPAVVRLGVRGGDAGAVAAHAWAECPGLVCLASADDVDDPYTPLR